jgi:hypothetical protein
VPFPGVPLDMTVPYAALCGEPWCRSPEQIDALTDRVIWDLYFHERDEKGRLVVKPEDEPVPPDAFTPFQSREQEKAAYYALGKQLGVPEAVLDAEWERKRGRDPG